MSISRSRRYRAVAAVLAAGALTLSACGSGDEAAAPAAAPASAAGSPAGSGSFPLTVENCGEEVTFEKAPERVVLLKSSPVPYLHELGVMSKVISRAGAFARDYYDDATWAELEDVPLLTDKIDGSGHLQISKEAVLDLEPDLVMGSVDNLSRETLAAVGIPLLEEPALCPEPPTDPSFASVEEQFLVYGKVFGVEDVARQKADAFRAEVEQATSQTPAGERRTAAVLYPTVGGGTTYAYGTRSMAHPQLEAAGFENVFADTDERVFEVTLEELIGRDPDVLVLLYSEGDPAAVEKAVTDLPGAGNLAAVRDGNVMTQLFNFTEPPSPLALDGLRAIVDRFGSAS
ncbi:ABC transporter substrate-binding protein [Motilibacter aurantiacus]|uniref:ABC transporter substrate-binding protein n=1 Tax=Motilibacter aurantiacus TaxID=2714955 RepID=UPI00140B55C2|nr:ABC transporter substrate-binding protein [Motilibacter aurantiacus]NHC44266.1 ABC transporter substrate-binding protein [Motilibacter aurantiacus]